jgi:hypothetical protein
MTTSVTIDAHAGWPVEVKTESIDTATGNVTVGTKIVDPGTQQTFYIYTNHNIVSIRELDRE